MPDDLRAVVLAGHTGAVDVARAGVTHADPQVRSAALGALARCGELAVDVLVAALGDDDAGVRRRAAEEAGRLGDAAVGPALVDALADAHDGVVEAAAHALGELPDPAPEWVVALAGLAAGHPEVVVRETAVAALGSAGLEEGRAAVLAATTDVATVRRRAVLALAAFDGDDVETALHSLAEDRDRQVRQSAEDLLFGWGSPSANG